MNRYLITGGAGYIGSHLAFRLAHAGYNVRILDNFSSAPKENVTALLAPFAKRVQILEGDIRDVVDCAGALKEITHVIHLASLNSAEESIEQPAEYLEVNCSATATLLQAVREADSVQRFVYGSSCAVYGETPAMSKHEASLTEPITPFGVSKLAGESICRSFYKIYNAPVICLRFFNAYGPVEDAKDTPQGFITRLLSAATFGTPAVLNGNGEQTRDFVYIDDCIDACIAACDAPGHATCGHVFNIGTGQRVSLNEVIGAAEKLLGRTIVVERRGLHSAEIRHSRADITKAAGMLQFTARVDFEDGLARTLASFQHAWTGLAKAA